MNGNHGWSFRLGHFGPVDVRLHASFFFVAIFILFVGRLEASDGGQPVWLAEWSVAVLLVSVVLHEAARLLTAFHFGGYAREVVLGPLGGLAPVHVPGRPRCEFAASLAGMGAAAALCLVCLPALLTPDAPGLAQLLNPLAPAIVDNSAALVFRVNWLLLLVNL